MGVSDEYVVSGMAPFGDVVSTEPEFSVLASFTVAAQLENMSVAEIKTAGRTNVLVFCFMVRISHTSCRCPNLHSLYRNPMKWIQRFSHLGK